MTHDVRGRGQSGLASGLLLLAQHIQKTAWQKVPAWTLEGWPWALTREHLSWWTYRLEPAWEISKRSVNRPETLVKQKAGHPPFSCSPSHLPAQKTSTHLPRPLLLPDIYFFIEHQWSGTDTIYSFSHLLAGLYSRLKAWSQQDLCEGTDSATGLAVSPRESLLVRKMSQTLLIWKYAIWIKWENIRKVTGFREILSEW